MELTPVDFQTLEEIIARHRDEKWALIPLLQEVMERFGYVPPAFIQPIAQGLGLFASQVRGVITFYAGFSLKAKGKHVLRCCRGTACHVKGSRSILRQLKKELCLDEGETTPDYQFTLETVACLGACFLAPTMMVDKTYFGKLSPTKIASLLAQYGAEKPPAGQGDE
ncbi:MAG: NADH-quinone oxidoreductase subunit NuoE [Desulfobacteraceae bacterium]|nr:NADH-quinone oxidoreductase subunit NuoE [Desulfobacteraceae bacterium]